MSIKTGNSVNAKQINSNVTVLLTAGSDTRIVITYASFHEQAGAAETIELFASTDSTTTSPSERIDKLTFAADDTTYATSAMIALPAGSSLLATGTDGTFRVAATLVYTEYSGTSV
jgi:hypothetical protein